LLNFIVMTPVLFFIGPDFLYSGADHSWAYKLDRNILLISSLVAVTGGTVGVALFLYLVLPWLSNAFGISKKRAISGLILAGIHSGFIIAFILGPVARSFEQFLGNWLLYLTGRGDR
jgi:hypothetical protein